MAVAFVVVLLVLGRVNNLKPIKNACRNGLVDSFGYLEHLNFILIYNKALIHDVNPSQLSGWWCISPSLREALLNARRDTVTHRATNDKTKPFVARCTTLTGVTHLNFLKVARAAFFSKC